MGTRIMPEEKRRANIGKLSGLIGILCNLLLAGSKLAAGRLSGSVSITADGINNFSDAASSVVTLTGFRLAERPADREHPFGHARYEYMASLTVAVMILFIGFELAKSSLEKLLHPAAVEFSPVFLTVLFFSVLVKIGLMLFNTHMGKKIHSTTLLATAQDSRNDALTTTAVIAASLMEHISGWRVDGIMGVLVSLFILWNGFGLTKQTISSLLGEGAKPDFRRALTDYVYTFPKILGCHDLVVHDYGPGRTYASIHLEFDSEEDLMACHEIVDQIERACLERYKTHLVVHLDPVITDDAEINRAHHWVESWLQSHDSRLTIHDFRMHSYDDSIRLVFDMIVPEQWQGREEALREELEQALNRLRNIPEEKPFRLDITFDPEE